MPSYIDGRKIEDFYDIGHKIGSGGFSTVRIATSKTDKKECAVKIIQKKALGSDLELVGKEIDIMRRIDHPHVIKLFDIFETSSHIYMVLELVTGGELFDRIVERGFFSEQDARAVIRCMLSAVDYLHKENIVHRDLKPENLLCTSRESDVDVKLADFGLSTVFDAQTILSTTCGTPGYVAPEVLMQRGYGKEVDLWSIGVIAYILFCGFPPFYSEDQNELFQQIITAKFDFPEEFWGTISDNAKDLVKGFLTADPAQRLTVAGALKHPFMMEDQSTTAIPGMAEHLEESILKKKFRAAAMTIEAVNRMARAVRFMQEMVEEKKAKQAAAGTAAAAGAFKKLKKGGGDSAPAPPSPPTGEGSTPASPVQSTENHHILAAAAEFAPTPSERVAAETPTPPPTPAVPSAKTPPPAYEARQDHQAKGRAMACCTII